MRAHHAATTFLTAGRALFFARAVRCPRTTTARPQCAHSLRPAEVVVGGFGNAATTGSEPVAPAVARSRPLVMPAACSKGAALST